VPEGGRPTPPRYREPLKATMRPSAEHPTGTEVEIPRGPRSKNPLSRPFQRAGEKAADVVRRRLADATAPGVRRLSEQGRAERILSGTAREARVTAESNAARRADVAGLRDLNNAITKLRSSKVLRSGSEALATWLHQHDLLDQPGMSPVEARDLVAQTMQDAINEASARRNPPRLVEAQKNVDAIRALPDHLLDLEQAPERVRRAVEASRKVAAAVEPEAQALFGLRPETQAARRGLGARILVGGSRFDPRLIRETPELTAAREAEQAARDALGAAQRSGKVARVRAATRRLDEAQTRLSRAREKSRGDFTPAERDYQAEQGIYVPWRSAEERAGRGGGPGPGSGYGFGPSTTKRATGESVRTGDVVMDPALVGENALSTFRVREAHRTLFGDGGETPGLLDTMLYHDADGTAITGRRAAQLAAADPERATLINVGRLRAAFERSQAGAEAADVGEAAAGDIVHDFVPSPDEVRQLADGRIPEGARQTDYVLANTKAVEEWRGATRGATTAPTRALDDFLSFWKAGVLVGRPAWFVHNLVNNVLQYGLLTGTDLKSILEATRNPEVRARIPARAEESSAAEVAGARTRSARGAHETVRARVGKVPARVTRAGFQFNDKLESVIRRGGYLAAAKQVAHAEGLAGSPEAILDAVAANPALARQALTNFHRFLGDYRSFSPFERTVLRRVFPFYSWLRTISRLAVTLPVRSPLRAQALALAGQAGTLANNPLDPLIPTLSHRGALNLDGYALGMMGSNPLGTLTGIMGNLGQSLSSEDALSAFADAGTQLAGQSLNPLLSLAVGRLTGIDPFSGSPYSAPPGFGNTAGGYGQSPQAINPVTGLPDYVPTARPGLLQQIASQVPLESLVRQVISGGRQPYDTTSDLALLQSATGIGAPPAWQAFQKPSAHPSGFQYLPTLGALASWLGAPVYRVDPQVIQQHAQDILARYQQAQQSTLSEQARLRAQVGG
jgi:hypothetical protein